VQIIDNPCLGGIVGLPADNVWSRTITAHSDVPFTIDFNGINNGECSFDYDLLDSATMGPVAATAATIFTIIIPKFDSI